MTMIKTISLQNYKCFNKEQTIPLAPITLMYGKNGRGKSSVAQALLLLGQTMRTYNGVETLLLAGEFVQLGFFHEILSQPVTDNEF